MKVELNNSADMVIAVTGFNSKLMIPVDQFMRGAGMENYSKIILFDPLRAMFLSGVPGHFDSFSDMISKLGDLVKQHCRGRLIVLGTSGGAHTALLVAHSLKADMCIAFAPYPYLSKKKIKEVQGESEAGRFQDIVERCNRMTGEAGRYLDVADTLCESNGKTDYFVHVSQENDKDCRRASSLESLPGFKIIKHPGKSHAVVAQINRYGLLSWCKETNQDVLFEEFYSTPLKFPPTGYLWIN